jgi:hypothetical protein
MKNSRHLREKLYFGMRQAADGKPSQNENEGTERSARTERTSLAQG